MFAIGKDGSSDMLATFPSVPEYKQLEAVFQTSRASLNRTRRADGEVRILIKIISNQINTLPLIFGPKDGWLSKARLRPDVYG